jgi:predicted DsbA family dithiol-disulfide isomerase
MANALFAAPVDDLTPEGCAKLAASLGLDAAAFNKCTSDPTTDAHIKDDQAAFKAAQGHGLPTLWIDDQKLEGYRTDGSIERTLETAIGKKKGQV